MDFNHVRPEHLCHPVEKVIEQHRQGLQICCKALNEKQAEVEKSLKDFAAAKKALKIAADNAKEEISKHKNEIIKAIEDVFQTKVNEVDQMYTKHEEKVTEQQNKVKSILDKVKCAGNLSKNLFQKGSDEEIIESQNLVEERLEKVKKESMDLSKPIYLNQKWYKTKQVQIDMVSKLFGTVVNAGFLVSKVLKDSKILKTDEYAQQLSQWFYKEGHIWQICYRASTDGWLAKNFHARCDDKGPTIVLVKVGDYIFGGFMDGSWKEEAPVKSKNAFMFSLKNKDNLQPFKSLILNVNTAAISNASYGAFFGNGSTLSGLDLFIPDDPRISQCYADLGNSYKLPEGYIKGTDKARSLLAGSFWFWPSEIEVFYQVKY